MFSQEPLSGVYSGMTPCWNSQRTIDQLSVAGQVVPDQEQPQRRQRLARRVAEPGRPAGQRRPRSLGGRRRRAARPGSAVSSAWSQGCSTAFGAFVTPLARTSPVAGRNRVSSLAVPPRMYSWGWRAGSPTGRQGRPAGGSPGTARPRPGTRPAGRPPPPAGRPARSAPFFFRLRVDHLHHPGLALALRRPGRAPGPRPLIGTARVAAAPAGSSSRPTRGSPSRRSVRSRVVSDQVAVPSAFRSGWPLRRRHDPRPRRRVVGRPAPAPGGDVQRRQPVPIEAPHQVGDRAAAPIARPPGGRRERLPRRPPPAAPSPAAPDPPARCSPGATPLHRSPAPPPSAAASAPSAASPSPLPSDGRSLAHQHHQPQPIAA